MIMSEADITRNAIGTVPNETVYPHFAAKEAGTLGNSLRWVSSMPAMLGALLVSAVFLLKRSFFVDPDMWWHLKTGELILSTHRWATTDPYSYTSAGAPWLASEWLGEVLLTAAYRLGWRQGLEALLIVLGSGVMVGLYPFATLRFRNCKAAFFISVPLIFFATV